MSLTREVSKNDIYILTADVGGSHITSSVCHLNSGTLLEVSLVRKGFSSKGTAKHILDAWLECLYSSITKAGVTVSGVGLAMPGPFDYQNGICFIKGLNKYEALYGMNIRERLAEGLNITAESFKFRNDAEAAIAGEWLFGAGKGYKNIIGVTLGTGFGSALTRDGVTIDLNLGSEKFLETIADDYLSTRWFLKRYYETSGISVLGVKELADLAEYRQSAEALFTEFGENMGKFLQPAIKKYQPESLIVCGNIAKSHKIFFHELRKWITVPIHVSSLWELNALLGALSMFKSSEN